jgi:hypothetical protein
MLFNLLNITYIMYLNNIIIFLNNPIEYKAHVY